MIFSALVKLAALIVLLLLGGIIVSLIFSSAEHSEIRFLLPVDQRVGCAERRLRCAGAHLRHAGDLVHRSADCGSGKLRYCPVPDGTGAGWLRRPLGIAIELLAAIPSIVYGMWGLFIFAPLFATYFRSRWEMFFLPFRLWAPSSLARHSALVFLRQG